MLARLPLLGRVWGGSAAFSSKKIEIFINNKPYQVDNNLSIFQAAKENGIEIPRFCYH
jgi:predicted molibdopterin-dependent oxidoreductase YjgC